MDLVLRFQRQCSAQLEVSKLFTALTSNSVVLQFRLLIACFYYVMFYMSNLKTKNLRSSVFLHLLRRSYFVNICRNYGASRLFQFFFWRGRGLLNVFQMTKLVTTCVQYFVLKIYQSVKQYMREEKSGSL